MGLRHLVLDIELAEGADEAEVLEETRFQAAIGVLMHDQGRVTGAHWEDPKETT